MIAIANKNNIGIIIYVNLRSKTIDSVFDFHLSLQNETSNIFLFFNQMNDKIILRLWNSIIIINRERFTIELVMPILFFLEGEIFSLYTNNIIKFWSIKSNTSVLSTKIIR